LALHREASTFKVVVIFGTYGGFLDLDMNPVNCTNHPKHATPVLKIRHALEKAVSMGPLNFMPQVQIHRSDYILNCLTNCAFVNYKLLIAN
jgi:hypothetical protein